MSGWERGLRETQKSKRLMVGWLVELSPGVTSRLGPDPRYFLNNFLISGLSYGWLELHNDSGVSLVL